MTDLHLDGMALGEGVAETIVALSLHEIEGVSLVGATSPAGLLGSITHAAPTTSGVSVCLDENGAIKVAVHVVAQYGYPLPELAARVRSAIADTMLAQVGVEVGSVDVYIDSIQF